MTVAESIAGTLFPGPMNLKDVLRVCPARGLVKGMGRVYAIETGGGVVKIGVSSNPFHRFTQLSNDLRIIGGREIGAGFISKIATNFRDVERLAHLRFRESRVGGEYFRIALEDAVSFIESRPLTVDFSRLEIRQRVGSRPTSIRAVHGFSTPIGVYTRRQASQILGVSPHKLRMKILDLDIESRFHPRSAGLVLTREEVDRLAASFDRLVEWDEPQS
jgi:T5orf172 domain